MEKQLGKSHKYIYYLTTLSGPTRSFCEDREAFAEETTSMNIKVANTVVKGV